MASPMESPMEKQSDQTQHKLRRFQKSQWIMIIFSCFKLLFKEGA